MVLTRGKRLLGVVALLHAGRALSFLVVLNKGQGKDKGTGKEKWKEKGKSKGKGKGKKGEKFAGWCDHCGRWRHKAPNCSHGKEKNRCTRHKAERPRSAQAVRSRLWTTNDVGAKEIGLIESVQEEKEMGWSLMIADAMAINRLSMDGAHSLVVDSWG